ncbi:MAG: glutaredoxin family protein [Promethearchaeota archaeon]
MIDIYPEILFFTSQHCHPCKPVEKILEKVNLSLFGKKLKIKKIDISKNKNLELIEKMKVLSVPTVIVGNRRLMSSSISEDDVIDAILVGFLSSVSLEEE